MILSSWLTVVSSSLTDCSSSLLVSSSSADERSSSFIAWSSSFDALASSTWVSYCSTVMRSCWRSLPISSSSCCVSGSAGLASCLTAAVAHRLVGVERDEQVAAGRFLFAQDRVDADVNQVRAVVEHGLHGLGFDVAALEDRLMQRRAQFRAQVGPRHADQVARRFAAGDLEETADPLGQVHDVVVLGRDERRRGISLEQALVQLARRNPFGRHPACADTR